jgi:hypothetical protein
MEENKVKKGRKERRIRFCTHTGVNFGKHEKNAKRRRNEGDEEEGMDRRKSRRRSPAFF